MPSRRRKEKPKQDELRHQGGPQRKMCGIPHIFLTREKPAIKQPRYWVFHPMAFSRPSK